MSATDFDFLLGSWTFHLSKLRDTHDLDCTEWVEYDATCEAVSILEGLGNIDRLYVPAADDGTGFEGMTVRLYDPSDDTWRIWWVSSRSPGDIGDPVVGRFADGYGIFENDEIVGGVPVRVRFKWFVDEVEPRFEQAFSRDGGDTWDTNWITTQRRR
jgi:hypothetical protein